MVSPFVVPPILHDLASLCLLRLEIGGGLRRCRSLASFILAVLCASSGQSGRSAGMSQGRLGLVCPPRRASSWLLLLYSRVVMSDPSPLPLLLVGVASPCSAPTRRRRCLRLRPPDEAPGQPLAETRAMSLSLSSAPTANVLRSGPQLAEWRFRAPPPAARRGGCGGGAVSGRALERSLDFHDISFLTSGDVTIYFSRCS